MKPSFIFHFVILISLSSVDSHSQVISGQILNSESKEHISYVNIGITGKNIGTVSDSIGNFSLDISEALERDTLRFSFIGYKSNDLSVQSIRTNGFPKSIVLEQKVFELNEVLIESKKLEPEKIGIRKKDGYPIPFYRKAKTDLPFPQANYKHEIGTLFRNNGPIHLDSIQINFSEFSIDILEFRVNVYSLQNGDYENALKDPIYVKIEDLKTNSSPNIDLSAHALLLEDNFLITIENYKRIPNGSIRIFANLKSKGRKFPTYYRSNSQSSWTNLKVKSKDFGLSIQAYIRK